MSEYCRECLKDLADEDGFCSDSCEIAFWKGIDGGDDVDNGDEGGEA